MQEQVSDAESSWKSGRRGCFLTGFSSKQTARGRYHILLVLGGVFLGLSFVIRAFLFLLSLREIDLSAGLVLRVFGVGLFYDIVAYSYFAAPIALYFMILPGALLRNRWHRFFIQALFFITLYALLFDAVAEYFFFEEFGTRFNFIAVDYLVYTREVIGNIKESYPLKSILGAILVATTILFCALRRRIDQAVPGKDSLLGRFALGSAVVLLPLLSFTTVDLTHTTVSANVYANELSGNGIYDLFAAFRNSELDYERFYPRESEKVVYARLRELVAEPNNRLTGSDLEDISREIRNRSDGRRPNVIVIVEESLSAEYLGVFGSKYGTTPNLDRLAGQSLLFTNFYATGTRTVRGLEAITLSTPPLPGESIVKRPNNGNLFSWGTVMRAAGYDTKFIYGGFGYFDNMNEFFSHNGFNIVDRSEFSKDEITFANIWGVCDEDLFRKVIAEGGKSYSAGKPFFSMVMTTSNHRPYTYPEGKIDIPVGTGRGGGVKYADYAIGRFLEEIRKKPWFDNTIIVIVADHCGGSAGKTNLPVKRYEIPLIIYSPSMVKPGRVDTLASQIDVAPTVLGLMQFSYRTRFLGKDILKLRPDEGRAFLSTYQLLGYVKDGQLLIEEPRKNIVAFRFDRTTGAVAPEETPSGLEHDMIAYYEGASLLYKNRDRIPPLREVVEPGGDRRQLIN